MNALLLSEQFDSFLVEEAVITTYNTFHIDGHLVKDFYKAVRSGRSLNTIISPPSFSSWKDTSAPSASQLIKGKKTPVSFKVQCFTLHLR